MLRWSSSVSSRTSIPTDSMPRKCKGRIRRSAYCPVCMYVFIRILPAGWEACQFIQSMHDSVSDTETAVILYLIHWLMVIILIILISFFLTIPLSYSNPESISSSSSLLLLRFDCNHMHFAEHYHTKFHPMSVVGEITVNKQTSSAI